MKITIEQEPGQAGETQAAHMRNAILGIAPSASVEVACRSSARVDSASDDRTANNAVRHAYRVLSDEEKAQMVAVKDKGAEFLTLVDSLGPSRETSLARTKIEEAVMWAVKHITA